jgi:hypothetical protein
VSRSATLQRLEKVLTGFLERAVSEREERLDVVEGISRLDDIARSSSVGVDTTDDIGVWLAGSNRLLVQGRLRVDDFRRIDELLSDIRRDYRPADASSAEATKIQAELGRWQETARKATRKLVLKRGPEVAPEPDRRAPVDPSDTIAVFGEHFEDIMNLWKDLSTRGKHLMSVLDDALVSARVQKKRDALLLSAFLIYYLKFKGYKVEPYVKRLKEAEKAMKWEGQHA